MILKYKCPCAIAKTSFFCWQGISLWWIRNKLIRNIWYTDIICLRRCHSYPCLLVKYGLGPRIFLRCGLIPKPILYYVYRQRPGDVKSVQWYFNKTEIGSLIFSKHVSFLTCAGYRGKKQYHFFRDYFHLNSFSLPCWRGKNSHQASHCVSPICYTVQGHIYCFKVSFLQIVTWECRHTVLMKQSTSDDCIG